MADEIKKIKAADILAFAADEKNDIPVEVTDDSDLYPVLSSVVVDVDSETHKCSLSGYYGYREDSPRYGLSFGSCEFSILGVNFSTPYDDHSSFETTGNAIDYGEMDEDEFWEELQELIDIPLYDCCDGGYEFDENGVTDEDLVDAMECECSVFAIDKDGDVCAFESEEDIPGHGSDDDEGDGGESDESTSEYEIIDEAEAFQKLAEDRPGLSFDLR